MNRFYTFLLLLVSFMAVKASDINPCATPYSAKMDKINKEFTYKLYNTPEVLQKNVVEQYLPLTIHIVGTDAGSGYMDLYTILQDVCNLNVQYDATEFHFYIDNPEFNYINDSDYYIHTNGDFMALFNNVQNTANMYFVQDPAGACGYFSPKNNPQSEYVALRKSCAGIGNSTWAHELGHYFALPHTFFGWEGSNYNSSPISASLWENVPRVGEDNSNCAIRADRFCGTTPDYYSDRWNCNGNGESSFEYEDPFGNSFRMDGKNYMSYSNDACTQYFSGDQSMGMQNTLTTSDRSFLAGNTCNLGTSLTTVNQTYPVDNYGVLNSQPFNLEWDAVPGAQKYFIQVTRSSAFASSVNVYEGIVDGSVTSVTLPANLSTYINRTYRWRIMPYTDGNTCIPMMIETFYYSDDLTSVVEIESVDELVIAPNPVRSGSALNINFNSSEAFDATVSVYNVAGQAISSFNNQFTVGVNSTSVSTDNLSSGIYFVNIETTDGKVKRTKFVVFE